MLLLINTKILICNMISVKLEYNSETQTAKYSLLKDNEVYDPEYVIELKLPFDVAYSLSGFLDDIVNLSSEQGYNNLLMKLDSFVNSHYDVNV